MAMKCLVRPSTPADAPAIVALLDQAGLRPNADPQHLHWKYWQPRADWPGPRSFVMTTGSKPIAHCAIVPGTAVSGARRAGIINGIDWVACAEALRGGLVGAGVALLKEVARPRGPLFVIGGRGETTLRILPHIGFRAAGVATGYVRTLSPLRLLRDARKPTWRLLPRFARSVAWTLGAPAAQPIDWRVHRIAGDDISRIARVFPVPARGMTVFGRSVELFRYVLSCPIVPMALYAVESSGRIRGYFLLASAPGQVRIADCWVDSDEPADWRAMILCAVGQARQDPRAAEVVMWASDSLLAEALRACGFHARFDTLIQVRPASDGSVPEGPLRVQMLDSDAAYLHQGRMELWA